MQRYKYRLGFTLIELLVVISIIALLASIVLASLANARAKAQLAAGQIQNTMVAHAFGADAVAMWNFDEGSGTSVTDNSGSGNSGTLTGTLPTWTTNTYNGNGSALAFDFNSGTTPITINSVKNLPSKLITVSAWVNLTGHRSWQNFVAHGWVGNGWLLFSDVNGYVYFGIGQSGSQYLARTDYSVSLNTWHFVLGTYDGSNVKVYIDGKPANVITPFANATLDTTSSIILGAGMIGTLDEPRVYTHALNIGEVQKLYAEGAPRHLEMLARK